jgi:phenylacetate-CoA ligase
MKEVEIKSGTPNALSVMLSHAAVHSPYYREQEWARRLSAGSKIEFREIPITGRRLVREETERFFPTHVPPSEGRVQIRHTSGSTGQPMLIRKTKRHFQINLAENRRLMGGWDLARHRRIAEIEFPDEDNPIGKLEQQVLKNGAEQWKLATLDGAAAFDLFRRTSATLAVAFPSIMQAALQHLPASAQPLSLRLISTISEVVSDELRQLVGQIPDCRLADGYGCVEAGLIAMQCPLCDAYHPADRHLVLELLGDDGRPVGPGQMGRVVVTPLFNRAMPLIRYETGDYAVAGDNGGCPRSARAIQRVIGRESGLFKLPDGTKVAAMLPPDASLLMGVRQFKLFQTSFTDVELHYVPKADGMEIAEDAAQDVVDKYLSPRFRIRCRRVAEIPRAPSGKYMMHECLI